MKLKRICNANLLKRKSDFSIQSLHNLSSIEIRISYFFCVGNKPNFGILLLPSLITQSIQMGIYNDHVEVLVNREPRSNYIRLV